MAYIYGTGELQVQYSSDGGVTWGSAVTPTALNAGGSFSHTGASYANTGTIFQPDVTYTHFRATLTGSGTTYYDDIYLRRALNSQLVVDGAIQASAIVAGAVQTYHLSVGPHYQFKAKAGGTPLMLNSDGTFSANSSANADENDTDAATYMDDARIYPATKTKTFEANFSGTQARGFLINMASAFGNETTGLRIQHSSSTGLTVHKVSGAEGRTYSAALTPTTGNSSSLTTVNDPEKITAIYSGHLSHTVPRRLILKLDGVEVATYSDTAIGDYYNDIQSGYAGIILGAHATRPGDVRVWGIALGIGSVTIQDGVVTADAIVASAITADKIAAHAITADKLEADLIMTNIIRSNAYTPGTASAVPVGFKLSGSTFTSTLIGGATMPANMEIGGQINIAGYKAATIADTVMKVTKSTSDGTGVYCTTSSSFKLSGEGALLTPAVTGRVLVIVSGQVGNSTGGSPIDYQLYYKKGGSVPSSGTSTSGATAAGSSHTTYTEHSMSCIGFTISSVLTGLDLESYWFDVAIRAPSGGTVYLMDGLTISLVEL
jgi:hypothetical protein